jgi:hypothetical protein
MGAINSSNRIAATLYSLGTWFVSCIYIYIYIYIKIPCIKEIVYLPMMMMMILVVVVVV